MKTGEGSPALDKKIIQTEEVSAEPVDGENENLENAPLSSFEFVHPGQKIEFALSEARNDIKTDLYTIELQAGPASEEYKAAVEAGEAYEEGVIKAAKKERVAMKISKKEFEDFLNPPVFVSDSVEVESPNIESEYEHELDDEGVYPLAETESSPEPVAQKELETTIVSEPVPELVSEPAVEYHTQEAEPVATIPEEPLQKSSFFSGRIGTLIEAVREKMTTFRDPGRIRDINTTIAIHNDTFKALNTTHDGLGAQSRKIENDIALFQERMKGKTMGDQGRAGETIVRLRKAQAKIEGQRLKLATKIEAVKGKRAVYENRRNDVADRVSRRFAERIAPVEVKLSHLENESVRLQKALEKTAQDLVEYNARLKEFESNKVLRKTYKDEFRSCKKSIEGLKLTQVSLRGRFANVKEGLVTQKSKRDALISLKNKTMSAGKTT